MCLFFFFFLLLPFLGFLYVRRPVFLARLWFTLCVGLLVLICSAICVPLNLAAKHGWIARRHTEEIACTVSGLLLGKTLRFLSPQIRVRVMPGSLDLRGIDNRGVFCACHTSFFDMFFFLWLFPLRFMHNVKSFAKSSLWRLPLMGRVIRACGHFPVYFTSTEASTFSVDKTKQAAVTEEAETFLSRGGMLCFFPEGAVNHTPKVLKEFRHGTFNMVLKHQVPIYYIVYFGCHEVWNPDVKGIPGFPGDVFFYAGKYEYEKNATAAEVSTGLRVVMQAKLDEILERRKEEHYIAPINKCGIVS
ncbi:putative acyltransferase [Trypanosoma theileri]|uniref:Putative acyltransferase n=1 Tax=Trypanosoma theileri TaxID=67003 RepID=A0A1X0P9F0_9TRYP|nr:putative acyltransferase [Trypanosoma theileri]ORC93461.1 putative acyltransferase [Trypanosoma theileri]